MATHNLVARVTRVLAIVVLFGALTTYVDMAAAQPASGPVLVIDTPPFELAGNAVLTGVAVDCGPGIAASRVAIYDGRAPSRAYLADVSMDTTQNLGEFCIGKSGTSQVGF